MFYVEYENEKQMDIYAERFSRSIMQLACMFSLLHS